MAYVVMAYIVMALMQVSIRLLEPVDGKDSPVTWRPAQRLGWANISGTDTLAQCAEWSVAEGCPIPYSYGLYSYGLCSCCTQV